MALTATIFKATLDVSDLRRHHYHRYSLTLARHPSETDERLMLRVLAFALFANRNLAFTRGLSSTDEPELWQRGYSGEIELWVELGTPTVKRLRRARSLAKRVVVLSYGGRGASQWWRDNAESLGDFASLTVLEIGQAEGRALATLAQRNMDLQCTVDEETIWFSDRSHSLEITPLVRQG